MMFSIDGRLAADSAAIGNMPVCQVRLMNDRRWPWLILVPRRAGLTEMHELGAADLTAVTKETALAASALKKTVKCEKINFAALGNIVRQLHIHVVARNVGDPNWPGPVWGFGLAVPYDLAEQAGLMETLASELASSGRFDVD